MPSNYTRKRKQHGGKQIDLRQLLMTDPIFTASIQLKGSSINKTPYLKDKGHQGFHLSRVNRMSKANLNKLEAIEIRPKLVNGKPVGRKIDGHTMPLYEIVNGRHRVAKALAEGRKTIQVKIL